MRIVSVIAIWAVAVAVTHPSQAAKMPTAPDPSLSPDQVVKAQLFALKHNDEPTKDAGIRTAFAFASPANRVATGPIERFILLVKNPQYASMLNYRTETFDPVEIFGERAQQRVTLLDAKGKIVTYLFTLSRQKVAPYQGCWMTDMVAPVEDGKRQLARAAKLPFSESKAFQNAANHQSQLRSHIARASHL